MTKCDNLELKCTKMHLAAGLCPGPLRELKRFPDPIAAIRGEGKRKGRKVVT